MENQFDNPNGAEETKEEVEETPEETPEETSEVPLPDKFQDKTPEEIKRSYVELEKKLTQQAQLLKKYEKAETDSKEARKIEDSLADIEKEILDEIEKADYSKMDAKEYGKFLAQKFRKMSESIAERKASDTYTKQSTFQQKVKNEIVETAKQYPLIDEKSDRGQAFRDIVLDIVSANRSRGKDISLLEAAKKAAALVGEQPEKKEIKKPKPLEKTQPYTPGENKTEEEEVINRIMRAGGGGPLRGL
jgi:hypothetical protein